MDGQRFDDLLRSLTESRRSLMGGTLAGLAGVLGLATVDAKKKHKKKKRSAAVPRRTALTDVARRRTAPVAQGS